MTTAISSRKQQEQQGMDVEAAFRAAFHIDPSVNVVELMDAVIDVASAIYPQQQLKKRTQTLIDEITRMRADHVEKNNPAAGKKSDDHDPCTKATANNNKSSHEKDKKKKKVDVVVAAVNEEKAAALDLKFENSMRRYQQGLIEIRKGKRKIQLLDVIPTSKRKLLCTKSRRANNNRLIRAVVR